MPTFFTVFVLTYSFHENLIVVTKIKNDEKYIPNAILSNTLDRSYILEKNDIHIASYILSIYYPTNKQLISARIPEFVSVTLSSISPVSVIN